jgi:hypothetical protein
MNPDRRGGSIKWLLGFNLTDLIRLQLSQDERQFKTERPYVRFCYNTSFLKY